MIMEVWVSLKYNFTNAAISKATLMSFPLVGNLSEKPRRIADKPQ